MKKFLFFLLTAAICNTVTAQNVGIGTNEPQNKLQVQGNLLVNTPTKSTNTAPTLAQIETIINAGTVTFTDADSTGRIYDPGGPSGNYNANITGFANILTGSFSTAIEITAESMQLGTGDSLIIKESASSSAYILLAVGNGYTNTGKWIFNSRSLYIIFKSNADANVGSGFSLLFKRLYADIASMPDVSGVTGKAFFFELNTGAFRSGNNTNAVKGEYSTAMGSVNTANGNHSTAIGFFNTTSGDFSSAMGYNNIASGFSSTAMGFTNEASGDYSTALGYGTVASGDRSTTLGFNTSSAGYAGTAIGMYNNPILVTPQTSVTSTSPLFIIGNGNHNSSLSNAMVVLKNGNVGIGNDAPAYPLNFGSNLGDKISLSGGTGSHYGFGIQSNLLQIHSSVSTTDIAFGYGASASFTETMRIKGNGNVGIGTSSPDASLHIVQAAGGGLLLENANDGNKWRIYSASGDNNLTFYNNAGTEVADIDDVTGAYTAISDSRLKKNIQGMKPVLPLLMKLNPTYYQFNWQQPTEQRQIGLMAQETFKLFPELVSYNKEKDLYKMNYAGFSTVAIKAIQEQQGIIDNQQKQIDELKELVNQLLNNK